MKNLSRSLTRSRNCQAFVVLSADSTDSPTALYASPKLRVRHGEFGIDFDSAPEKRYGRGIPGGYVHLHSGAVSLQGFE